MHLIGHGERLPLLGCGFAGRCHWAVHTGEGITDRNQLAALTLHAGVRFDDLRGLLRNLGFTDNATMAMRNPIRCGKFG